MNSESPYIHPQVEPLLAPADGDAEDAVNYSAMTEEQVIAMRSEAVAARAGKERLGPELPRVQNFEVPGAGGDRRVRLYDPIVDDQPMPLMIFLHGGGWCGGDIDSRDDGVRILAAEAGVAVLSVDYALAPEHKFPRPLDDVVAVSRWIRDNAEVLGVDSRRIAIGGDSAGANLALAAALDLRDAGEHFLVQLMLFYGVYAHDHSTESHRRFGKDDRFTLSSEAMDLCWRMYLSRPEQDRDPRAAPLLAELSGLASAYVMCGGLDPLLDDSKALYDKMQAQSVDATLKIYPGVPHSFLSYIDQIDTAREAWVDAANHLRRTLLRDSSDR